MTSAPPFDPTAPLAAAYEDAFRRLEAMVESRLLRAGLGPNGLDLANLLGGLSIPTGRAIVAKASPLKVEFPASPAVMVLESGYIRYIHGLAYTAPGGAAITAEIRKWAGGTTWNSIHNTTPLTIPADGHYGMVQGALLADYAVARGDWIALDVTQVGASPKGDLLTVILEYDAPVARRSG